MRYASLVIVAFVVVLLAACGGDDPAPIPTPTAPPPAATAVSPAPTAALPPISNDYLAGPSMRLENLAGAVWQREGGALLVYNRYEVQLIDPSGVARSVLKAADGEDVAGVSETGLVVTTSGMTATIRNVLAASVTAKKASPREQFTSAVLSPDGTILALTLADRIAVQLWDVKDERLLREYTGFQTAAPVYGVRFTPNGRSLIWTSRARVQVMDIATGAFGPSLSHEDFVGALASTSDGVTFFTAAGTKLTSWDVAIGQTRAQTSLAPITALALSPDNRTLAVATQLDGGASNLPKGVKLFDASTLKEIASLPSTVQGGARILAFSPDARQLAVSDENWTNYRLASPLKPQTVYSKPATREPCRVV